MTYEGSVERARSRGPLAPSSSSLAAATRPDAAAAAERCERPVVVDPAELAQAAGGQRDGTHRDVGGLVEPSLEPPKCGPLAALGVVERDQRRQLERLGQLDMADLARGRLGQHQVAVL